MLADNISSLPILAGFVSVAWVLEFELNHAVLPHLPPFDLGLFGEDGELRPAVALLLGSELTSAAVESASAQPCNIRFTWDSDQPWGDPPRCPPP